MKLITTIALTLLTTISLSLQAKEKQKETKITLSEFTFSETVVGEKPTKSFLEGKVVIIEYWGIE